jgi:inner membrane protein
MTTEKINSIFNSYTFKMVVVVVLALFLLLPTIWIQKIIDERISLKSNIESEMAAQWGQYQNLTGPVLNVPFTYQQERENEAPVTVTGIAHFLPDELKFDGTIKPEIRKRGIYKIPVYKSEIKIAGSFKPVDFNMIDIPVSSILWNDAYFTVGINDLSGIEQMPDIKINHQDCQMEPGVLNNDLFTHGITIKTSSQDLSKNIEFDMNLNLRGSMGMMVDALGKNSQINISSPWSNPSFTGSFLPSLREVNNNGFKARWNVTYLNRNFPQQWFGKKFSVSGASVGVDLLVPVDHYQKSTRSVKYAILFIALNFIVFFFIEVRNKRPIHPFQYSLVAFALLLFYTLLTAIGEQIGFNAAFVVSALAVTGLITWYSYSLLKSLKMAVWIFSLQTGLYIFLFTILQLQDYALIMGSIGLFIILGIIMKFSQQIKWYNDQSE